MNRCFVFLFFVLAATASYSQTAIFYATDTLPVADRSYIQTRAGNLRQWFHENGLEAELLPDAKLVEKLPGLKLALLVAPSPTPGQLRGLASFTQSGGKLAVFYSNSEPLAKQFGVRLEPHLRPPEPFAAMRFTPGLVTGVPQIVLQHTTVIHPAFPATDKAKVLATWTDKNYAATRHPAVLATPSGFWFTQLLQPATDAGRKSRLLMLLAGHLHPPALAAAAQNILAQTTTQPTGSLAYAQLLSAAQKKTATAASAAELATLRNDVSNFLASGKNLHAWETALLHRRQAVELYARLQSPRANEIRGVWDHSGAGLYPGDWPRTCRELADAGISDIFVNIAGPGFAHYPSLHLPRSAVFATHGDQLAAALAAAKPRNIRVHAWILFASTTGATPERLATLKPLLLSNTTYLNPAAAGSRKMLADTVAELAQKYPGLAGVHLDYIRWPDFPSSLGKETQTAFLAHVKKPSARWPADVEGGGALRPAFFQWRADAITRVMRETRAQLKKANPALLLTAAVYGKHPQCRDSVGQDWEAWVNQDLLDYAIPMDYTQSLATLDEWLGHQTRTPVLRKKLLPGLGVTAAESRLDAPAVIDQIFLLRKKNTPGFVLFDLNATLAENILPMLKLGITK
ncbi:MAG: family 10 glycosylhydrolase [Kiritimatiellaeota bacterium]|nr:family 10 glycosylhydrolase [Kiritimatiellota bacterium]